MFEDLAEATLRIECGEEAGSGFHFVHPNLVVTNDHVVADGLAAGDPVVGVCEDGSEIKLARVASSPQDEWDFAILKARSAIPSGRVALQPKAVSPRIGTEVAFSGFPHGISDLLVHRAIVSGTLDGSRFYLDGSVNGGNSGGPIVDTADGTVIGVVTQRRFLGGPDLDTLYEKAEDLRARSASLSGRGVVANFSGIDFMAFAQLMGEAMILISEVLKANANTGIGIGFPIEGIEARCREERLI